MAQYYFNPEDWAVGDGVGTAGFPFEVIAGTFSTIAIAEDSGSVKYLSVDSTSERKILAFTASGVASEIEMYVRLTNTGLDSERIGVRAKNSSGINFYQWRLNNIDTVVNGSLSNIASTSGQSVFDNIRFGATGTSPTTVRMRGWSDGDAEPSTWAIEVSNSATALQADGYAALTPFRNSLRCYGFGVGTNGDPAPTRPLTVSIELFLLRHNPRTNKVIPTLTFPTVTDIGATCVRPRVTKGF